MDHNQVLGFSTTKKKWGGVLGFMVSHMLVTNVVPLGCGKEDPHHSCRRSMLYVENKMSIKPMIIYSTIVFLDDLLIMKEFNHQAWNLISENDGLSKFCEVQQ